MKLLLLNGNTDPAITERMAQGARGMCQHEIVPMTARFGARYIASRAASAVAAHAVLDALASEIGRDNPKGYDAAIIGCFGDPGLEAARECFPIPILGMADAAIFAALRLAPRVGVLTGGAAWVPMLEEFFLLRGLGPDKVRVAAIPPTGDMIAREPVKAAGLLAETARGEVARGAGVILLGGAGLVGLDALVAPQVTVPVLDGLRCAIEAAETATAARQLGSIAPSIGLSDALAASLAG
ncbi:aspartate/glutamate racemase family protein [Sediminicoccus rosea]|uniref:Aspartate/glutamate racemase family protein n=1 Tax=Sediminicoccus rosea TaxID=1225128 RepID=A0ABZ0PLE2_9PROT|nr:aspartate/glutamate racemase family protein [Sediminicoccus rosea]WPB86287.1 aspartate/glutamate racemase family protein [Sediminicoccus rosea]